MADLQITITGDAKTVQDQFQKLTQASKQLDGSLGAMKQNAKDLKAALDKTTDPIKFVQLKNELERTKDSMRLLNNVGRDMSTTLDSKFSSALDRAGKKLFDLGNVLKASVGFLGVAGLVGSFVEATGAAKALDEGIKDLVDGLKLLNKTGTDIAISGTSDTFSAIEKYLDSTLSTEDKLIKRIDDQVNLLRNTKTTVDPSSAIAANLSAILGFPMAPNIRDLTQKELDKIQETIDALNAKKNVIIEIGKESEKTAGKQGVVIGVPQDSPFYRAASESATSSGYDAFLFDRRQKEIEARREASRQVMLENEKIRSQDEKDRIASEQRIARERLNIANRYSAGISNIFEDAVSAGMRGGFQDFLRNYMMQSGVRLLGGLLRLALSGAGIGSFGIGDLIPKIFGFAGGGEFYTSGPRMIMVGDNPGGIEKVSVTPISGKGTTGIKNGNIALGGGGDVYASPSMGQSPIVVQNHLNLKIDSLDVASTLEMPNGGYDKLNRMRGNPA